MYYVYQIISVVEPARHYTGITKYVRKRLRMHNEGLVMATSPNRPWNLEVAIAFRSRDKAVAFEAYLKSHSGRSFSKRHF